MALGTLTRSRSHADYLDDRSKRFSLDPEVIEAIFRYAKPLGHHESTADLNLGFGFLYYGLARTLRSRHVVVIGSGFGFSVVCLGLALNDNGKGRLSFVDPSYSVLTDGPLKTVGGTSQWDDPDKVARHFARFGLDRRVTHYRLRSGQFFARYAELDLPGIDLAFIDGSHAYKDVRHDFMCALAHARNIYVRELVRHAGVKRWLKSVAQQKELFEIVDFPFASGVAIVRVLEDDAWKSLDSSPAR